MNDPGEDIRIRVADWERHGKALGRVRYRVFVVEQEVPEEEEWDGMDEVSLHAMATAPGGEVIATGRLLPAKSGVGRIGRMAVLEPWRGRGIGTRILHLLVDEAARRGDVRVELEAQTHAVPFYERHGFAAWGAEFLDAGIPHRWMGRDL